MKSKKKQRLLALILSMVLMLSASMHRVWNKRQYRKPR